MRISDWSSDVCSSDLLFAVLTILLSGALSPAHAEWQEASSRHFLVYGDVSARQVRAYAERLERYDSALRFITGQAETAASRRHPVTVYLLPRLSAVRKPSSPNTSPVTGFHVPSFQRLRAFI